MPEYPNYDQLTSFGKCVIDNYATTQNEQILYRIRSDSGAVSRRDLDRELINLRNIILMFVGIDKVITELGQVTEKSDPAYKVLDDCIIDHKPTSPLTAAAKKSRSVAR